LRGGTLIRGKLSAGTSFFEEPLSRFFTQPELADRRASGEKPIMISLGRLRRDAKALKKTYRAGDAGAIVLVRGILGAPRSSSTPMRCT